MKKIIIGLLMMTSVSAFAADGMGSITFSRNLCPYSASLTATLMLTKTLDSKVEGLSDSYDAIFTRPVNGDCNNIQTETLANGMSCSASYDSNKVLQKVFCSNDGRKAGGALITLTVQKIQDAGSYDIFKHVEYQNIATGKKVKTTDRIAWDIMRRE